MLQCWPVANIAYSQYSAFHHHSLCLRILQRAVCGNLVRPSQYERALSDLWVLLRLYRLYNPSVDHKLGSFDRGGMFNHTGVLYLGNHPPCLDCH